MSDARLPRIGATAISRRDALTHIAGAAALAARPARTLAQVRAASGGGAHRRSSAFIPASDPRLTFEGRTAPGPDGSRRIGFPGVVLRFRTDGARVTAHLTASSDDVYVDLTVAGAPARRIRLTRGAQEVVLHAGAAEPRTIALLKRTESWQGTLEIAGVQVDSGAVAPVSLPDRRLVFIGDSITCGSSSDVPDASSTEDGAQTNDGAKSFGRVLAARLGAACHLVGYGGRGVIRDWQGIRDIANAPVFYERAMPDEPAALWDHRAFVPHAVGICLGTNDFNQGVPDQNEFVNAYVDFVRKVLRDAPGAVLFVIDSPMTADSVALG
ncbi:MAG TPA: GDSL-type esterase/lipase family protein, partial [Gemmatirosa sp.]